MSVCSDRLQPPYQNWPGKLLDKVPLLVASGAIIMLNFSVNSYILGGRTFSNPALVVSSNVPAEAYMHGEDGANVEAGLLHADIPRGTYDMVLIDPYGGEVQQGVNIQYTIGYYLQPVDDRRYIQLVLVFPAGAKTLPELEALIMPLNVHADWAETDPGSAGFILNKPAFITEDDLNILLATTIAETIVEQVGEQLDPVIDSVASALQDALDAVAGSAQLDVNQQFTKPQRASATPIPTDSTLTADLAANNDFEVTGYAHTGTLANPTNQATQINQKGSITITQDGTGGHPLAFASNWKPFGQSTAPSINTTAGVTSVIDYHVMSATVIRYTLRAVGA